MALKRAFENNLPSTLNLTSSVNKGKREINSILSCLQLFYWNLCFHCCPVGKSL